MAIFDQRNQKVNYQYNVNGVINFGTVQNKLDAVGELKKLQAEIVKAADSGALDTETAIDAKANIEKAIAQSQKPEPDKKVITDYLKDAKNLLSGITLVAGLVKGISEAIEMVRKFF